jgi:hypothetical protein
VDLAAEDHCDVSSDALLPTTRIEAELGIGQGLKLYSVYEAVPESQVVEVVVDFIVLALVGDGDDERC